jgi:hypothetical protein
MSKLAQKLDFDWVILTEELRSEKPKQRNIVRTF